MSKRKTFGLLAIPALAVSLLGCSSQDSKVDEAAALAESCNTLSQNVAQEGGLNFVGLDSDEVYELMESKLEGVTDIELRDTWMTIADYMAQSVEQFDDNGNPREGVEQKDFTGLEEAGEKLEELCHIYGNDNIGVDID